MKKIIVFACLLCPFTAHSERVEPIDSGAFITGAQLSEIEGYYQKNIKDRVDIFFSSITEEIKGDYDDKESRKQESLFIARYNKKIGALKEALLKKIAHIDEVFEREMDDKKSDFIQHEGAEDIIRVHYSKEVITHSQELRNQLILKALKKTYRYAVKLHTLLEKKIDTYYLARLRYHIVTAYQEMISMIEGESQAYGSAITRTAAAPLVVQGQPEL